MHIMGTMRVVRWRTTFGPWLLVSLMLAACGGGGRSGTPQPVTAPPSDFQYPAAPTFVVGTAITPLVPTVAGEVAGYSVSPSLPLGLSLNTTTGVISGTPTSPVAKAGYSVDATNAGGSTKATVSIAVMAPLPAAPSDLSYSTPPTLIVGTTAVPMKPSVVGEVTGYGVSPPLPAGLGLDSTTGVISGIPTSSAAKADYIIEAANAGGNTTTTVSITVIVPTPSYTGKSGFAQKGPLILGSPVTAQELDATLSPTGQEFSYQILSNLGAFSLTSTFTSPYLGLSATGYYFDEVANTVSSGPETLNAYSDLAVDSVVNVNLLTTLEYQRIQNLVATSNMAFAAARAQAETEVLAALNIPAGSYGSFDSLDLSGNTDGDHILAAISALFVYGNSAGHLSQLIASFQSDIGKNGLITNPATAAALVKAAEGMNPTTVAANLTNFYAAKGLSFTAADLTEWIAQSGDGVIGKFAFSVPDATPSTVFTVPSYVVSQFVGTPVSVSGGRWSVNGVAAIGAVTLKVGDAVAVSPNAGDFPNGILNCYLVTGNKNLARVSFVGGLISIAITPNLPGVPVGLTQQLRAIGTFSDTSAADVSNSVVWSSATPTVATVNASSGLANALTLGSTVITATSGSVSGNTTLTVTPAVVQSIAIVPNPITTGVGVNRQLIATGTYSDGTLQPVTTTSSWTSDTPSVATVGPTTGIVAGMSNGSATISATIGSVTGTAPLSVITDSWVLTGDMTTTRAWFTSTLLLNGTVLAAGGGESNPVNSTSSSTEIYDPVAGAWTATGSMATPRSGHTATLLPNGQVLVAGGASTNTPYGIASAELYNPTTGTWASAGNMSSTRVSHVAVLLVNGTVLIAGGYTPYADGSAGPGPTTTAEIYNPATGTWTPTGSMMLPYEQGFIGTLLPDGRVLVTGGGDPAAELYDPVSGTWSATGSMVQGRNSPSSTLLPNGTVLVAGGGLASAEIYDPAAGTWTLTGNMTAVRDYAAASPLPNGTVLVTGGAGPPSAGGLPLASAEIYDPAAGTWAATGSMSVGRLGFTATPLPNGEVLAAGFSLTQGETTNPSSEIFYP